MPKETEGFGMLDGKTYFVLSTYNIQKTTFIFQLTIYIIDI